MKLAFFRKKSKHSGKLAYISFIVWIAVSKTVSAQGNSFELWPETNVWNKIAPDIRFSLLAAITRYLESNTRDINLTFQADYSFGYSKRFFFTKLADQNRVLHLRET
jgi:hypothetical protein